MAGAGAKPSPGPLLPIPGRTLFSLPLGDRVGLRRLRRRCVLHHIPGWAGGGVCGVVDELVVDGVGEEVRRAGGDRPRAAKRLQGRIADATSRSAASEILQGVFLPALTHQSVDVTPPALTVVSLRP